MGYPTICPGPWYVMSPPRPVSYTSTPRERQHVVGRENVRAAAVATHAERQHVRMLDEQQHVADLPLAAIVDELLLQGQRLGVRTRCRDGGLQAAVSSQFSSARVTCAMNWSATAPSMMR